MHLDNEFIRSHVVRRNRVLLPQIQRVDVNKRTVTTHFTVIFYWRLNLAILLAAMYIIYISVNGHILAQLKIVVTFLLLATTTALFTDRKSKRI